MQAMVVNYCVLHGMVADGKMVIILAAFLAATHPMLTGG
jgi:hypothetical protein